jgi:hypothetical protein
MSSPAKPGTKVKGRVRYTGGKEVKPTLYCGKWEGHGSYMSGTVDGELVCDKNGKPLSLKQIGELR